MTAKIWIVAGIFAVLGFSIAKIDDHVKSTMWGWVWELRPLPDFYGTQLVKCPNGDITLPPWHVLVLWDQQAPIAGFLQERGR